MNGLNVRGAAWVPDLRPGGRLRGRLPRWLVRDGMVFYTATLAPVALAVAAVRREPLELLGVLVLTALALATQATLPRLARDEGAPFIAHSFVRLGVVLLYVAAMTMVVGGAPYPLLCLFVPVVAGAAALGAREAIFTAAVTVAIYLVPQLGSRGAASTIGERGIALAGVAVILAFGTHRFVSALQRVSEQQRVAVLAERRRSRQIAGLESVGRALAAGGPTPQLLDRVADIIGQRFGYPLVSVHLIEGGRLQLGAQRGYASSLDAVDGIDGIVHRALRTQEVILVTDVEADPDYVPIEDGILSEIVAPLAVDGTMLGVLTVESRDRRLDRTDRDLVGVAASRIAGAIALGTDRRELADRVQLLRTLHTLGEDVSGTLVPERLHAAIVDRIADVVPASVVALTVLDRSDGTYRVALARGADEAIGAEVLPGSGLAGRAIRDRALVIEDDLHGDASPVDPRNTIDAELQRGVGVPFVRDGVVVGALSIARTAAEPRFSRLEIEALQLFGTQSALAIANSFLHAEVTELAIRDALTGLYNRRHFDTMLNRLLVTHHRHRAKTYRPISAIVFDLDHFGTFNKAHGHQVGDEVLRTFAAILRERFRASDLVARTGGEEFVAVLDGASRDHAVAVAEEVRAAMAAETISVPEGRISVTVSAGCAQLDESEPTRAALLRTADVALFMAKRGGRDRVVAA